MIKMVFVALTIMFTVAACNKNNSKANRVRQDPLGAQSGQGGTEKLTPEQQREKAEKEKAEREKVEREKVEREKAESEKAEKTETDRDKKDGAGQVIDASKENSDDGAVTSVDSKSIVTGGAVITNYENMNYNLIRMTTNSPNNYTKFNALLGRNDDEERESIVYCYVDSEDFNKNKLKENKPELYLFPNSEALIEIKAIANVGNQENSSDQNMRRPTKYVLSSCEGDESLYKNAGYYKANSAYEMIYLKSGWTHEDYLKTDKLDNLKVDVSIRCDDSSNILSLQERIRKEKIVTNRITLRKNAKIMFARPLNFIVEKTKGSQPVTLGQKSHLKSYVIVECE